MTKKNTKIAPPAPKKIIGKGAPPPIQEASKNLDKLMDAEHVAFNFRVPAEFRKRVRQYALDHDTTAVQVMMKAVEELLTNKR